MAKQKLYLVKGHWRWQSQSDGTKRKVWVAPHIRETKVKPH